MAQDLITALADLEEKEVIRITQKRLNEGDEAVSILKDARNAMEIVGRRFEASEYFIPDLVYAGEILKQVSEMVKPKLRRTDKKLGTLGKVVIGTVAGDIHDIGKDIVVFMLDVSGFEVFDLGIDTPAQKFVEKIEETKTDIVGLSGFLTLAFDSMKQTVAAIKTAGLRDKVKIMIGGGQIDERIREYTGADAYGKDAMAAVSLAKGWIDRR
jgi:5-methyltetrahydrofolate--homocysteine methyltransferase